MKINQKLLTGSFVRVPVVQPLEFTFATPTGAAEIEGPLRILTLAVISTRVKIDIAGLGVGVGAIVGQGEGVATGGVGDGEG